MTEPVIRVENVTRTYHVGDQDVHALAGVNLVIKAGEFVAIMGSSGSGKSTLMAILGGLDRPSSGQYFLDGVDVARLDEPALARIRGERLGFVFQSFNLLARTTALENTALPLIYASAGPVSRADREARARASLALLGLGSREHNTPAQLSGGQQQRVAIARALINAPSLLLADEPTGNLDTRTSHEIMDTLVALNHDRGVTIVVVTHEPDIAAYAGRVVTMRDGLIVSDARPETPAVASGVVLDTTLFGAAMTSAGAAVPREAAAFSALAAMILTAAVQAVLRNRTRSALTMLGVFIGVAALIVMVSVGQGGNEAVLKQIQSLGTNLLVVVPGAVTSGGLRAGAGSASVITIGDAQAIRREDTSVASVSYLIRQSGQIENGNRNWSTSIQGVSPNYPPVTNWQIAAGRAITEDDDGRAALVILLGATVARQLFGDTESPLGRLVQAKGVPLRVIGVLMAKGQTAYGQDQDDVVMIPFSTGERKVLGVAAPSAQQTPLNWVYPLPPNPYALTPRLAGFVNQLYLQAESAEAVQPAIRQVSETLRRRHRIAPGGTADFAVRNLSQIAETAASSGRIMALLLAAVASISLLVGGIGIMNILLVSVTERTREIGLRMAIGARRLHVLLQFLTEAVLMSVSGGVAGILAGLALSQVIGLATGWPVPTSPVAIVGGFLFSAAVGIFFGYYPARKAARLDPIEALRYE
jgi:macrolide transport system ATP-binding/permease protein